MTDVLETGLWTVPSDPDCPARRHRTRNAYRRHGCRCGEAVRAYQAFLDYQAAYRRARRRGKNATQVARRIGQGWDPRARHDGPRREVSRINLLLLCSGFVDSPTVYERTAAVIRLSRTGNRAGTGLMSALEIAERIGCSEREVVRCRRKREALRGQRTARRLADARWRAWRKHGNGW